MLKLFSKKQGRYVELKTSLFSIFYFFFKTKNNWFFTYKLNFFFKNYMLSRDVVSFFWDIPKRRKNKNKRIKVNFFYFKKSFFSFLFRVLDKRVESSDVFLRFLFINRFFFIFWRKEWFLLRKKRLSLSLFIRKRKLKLNLKVLKQKFYIKNSFFLKKKNKHLFNYNLGYALSDY